jgi:hypothetical protein
VRQARASIFHRDVREMVKHPWYGLLLELCHRRSPEYTVPGRRQHGGKAVLSSYIARWRNDLIREYGVHGRLGYAREGSKSITGISRSLSWFWAVQLGFFSGCRAYYPLDFSSFGRKL